MDNVKDDNYYIQKIRQDLEFIIMHETLKNDIPEMLKLPKEDSVVFALARIRKR